MNDTDKKDFADKMLEMSKALGRVIDDEDIDAYFNQLQDLPLELVIRGIDYAIRDRDPRDEYATALINVPEIRGAVARMMREADGEGDVAGCEACNMTGWVLTQEPEGQPKARPCECLYKIAKKLTMNTEEPTAKDAKSRKNAESIVNAYERHQAEDEENGKTKSGGE